MVHAQKLQAQKMRMEAEMEAAARRWVRRDMFDRSRELSVFSMFLVVEIDVVQQPKSPHLFRPSVSPYAISQKVHTDAQMAAAEKRWVRRHHMFEWRRELLVYSKFLAFFPCHAKAWNKALPFLLSLCFPIYACNTLCADFLDALQETKSQEHEAMVSMWHRNIEALFLELQGYVRRQDDLQDELTALRVQKVHYVASKLAHADFGQLVGTFVYCCT